MWYGLGKRGNPAGAYGKGRWLKWPKPAWPLTETRRRGRAGRLHREAAASVPAGGRSEPRRPAPAAVLPLPAGRTWPRPRRRGGFAGGRDGKGREGTGRSDRGGGGPASGRGHGRSFGGKTGSVAASPKARRETAHGSAYGYCPRAPGKYELAFGLNFFYFFLLTARRHDSFALLGRLDVTHLENG